MKLIYIISMYGNQCFDFRKLIKMNYIERFNLVLSAKMEISKDGNLGGLVVITSTLSAVLSTQSMYAEFPLCHKGSINKGGLEV